MKTKYTKKQITEAIKHWQQILESMYDGKSILREFNENVNMLDNELKKKLDIRLDILRDLIFKLKSTINLPDEDIPLENELGYAIADLIKGLVLCDATTKNSVNEDCKSANDFVIVNGKKISTDGAIVDNGINWIYFWFDTEDAALDWYKREFGIEYNRDLLVKPTKRDMPGKFDDKFGIGMHK